MIYLARSTMPLILLAAVFFLLAALANLALVRNDPSLRQLLNVLLLLLNLPVFFAGLMMLFVQPEMLSDAGLGLVIADTRPIGISLLVMAIWGTLVTLPEVRRWLSRVMPLDPESPVHVLALVCVGYLVGSSLLSLGLGGLESLAETATAASIIDVIMSQLLFLLAGLAGVGLVIRRDWRKALDRLGLERPTLRQLIGGLGWVVVLVIMQSIVGAIWLALNPEEATLLEEINTLLLGEMDTVWEWFLLAAAAALGEEILFRGALQPVFGLWFTAFIFAFAHVQYGFTVATLFLFVVGIVLGIVRRRSNTTTAIYVHFCYDFALGVLVLLAPYLESFATG